MRKLKNTRESVLFAAVNCFAEKGFYGTTIREIGAACNVTDPTIYHYFANKEELFRKAMDYMHHVYFLVLKSILIKDADLRSELTSYFFAFTEWGKSLGHVERAYIETSIAHVNDFFHSTPTSMKEEFRGRFHRKFKRLLNETLTRHKLKENLSALVTYFSTFLYGFSEKVATINPDKFTYDEIADGVEQFMQFIFRTQHGIDAATAQWELSAPSMEIADIQTTVQKRLRDYPHKIFSFNNFVAYIRYGQPT